MATAITANALYTSLDLKTNNKFSRISNDVKLEMLNEAIINRFYDIRVHCRQCSEAKATLTFASEGYVVDLPTDFNYDRGSESYFLYSDNTYRNNSLMHGKDIYFYVDGTELRFEDQQKLGEIYYLKYCKEPTQYTAIGDTVAETVSTRALFIIKNEIESIFESRKYQGQISASSQASTIKANNQT